MKRLAFAVAVLCFASFASADGALYAKKCTACHGKDGKGTGAGKKMGAQDLTATKLSEAELVAVISGGRGKMTAYKGKLTDAEIASLAKFIKAGLK